MIRNGLLNAFPCHVAEARQVHKPTAAEKMDAFVKTVKFMAAVKEAMGLLGVL
jgi:hypothetical protein